MIEKKSEKLQIITATESLINVLGVVYHHKKASDGGDLYLTHFGLKWADHLKIENWYEKDWFHAHRELLKGTSAVHRVPTKEVNGCSLELVVKNCRVGEDVPLDTKTLDEFADAEFNSPWEEFALVMELRRGAYGPQDYFIKTQKPLAIYVPSEKMQLWQSGRSADKMNRINVRHPGIELDILRQYKLVYGWIKGKNILDVFMELGLNGKELKDYLRPVTLGVIDDLERKGYAVADIKPEHIIISEDDLQYNELKESDSNELDKQKNLEYIQGLINSKQSSMVDYELLLRTPEHEKSVRDSRRHSYLFNQRDRFIGTEIPPHLKVVNIMNVPYVYGNVESTGGKLWVVGVNAKLYDYFLPERWRNTEGWKLSEDNDVFYAHTKDHVHIVWRTSRVGETRSSGLGGAAGKNKKIPGFNSPFEETAISRYLNENGIKTVYTRAIYMTGSPKIIEAHDLSRYENHKDIKCPDGCGILSKEHYYIIIRGYYNGPDEWVAQQKGDLYRPVNLNRALSNQIVTMEDYIRIWDYLSQEMKNIGIDGSFLRGNDVLLAMDPGGKLLLDKGGIPEVRICNFEALCWNSDK